MFLLVLSGFSFLSMDRITNWDYLMIHPRAIISAVLLKINTVDQTKKKRKEKINQNNKQ